MGQVLHGCATTTAVLRRTIQSSQESLTAMALVIISMSKQSLSGASETQSVICLWVRVIHIRRF